LHRTKVVPFQLNVVMPTQKLEWTHGLERVAMSVRADKIGGRIQCAGLMFQPISWNANLLLAGERVTVQEKHGGHDIVFDELVLPVQFRGASLQWQGLRMVGEDVSVLGNGRVSFREGIVSVTRLIVSPEVSVMVARGLQGAGLVSHGDQWWSDLDTPDRKVRDLLVTGSVTNPVVDAGYQHRELPIWGLVRKTISFIQDEMREERLENRH